jgi:hypothetical protein
MALTLYVHGTFRAKNHVDGTFGSRRARSWMLQYSTVYGQTLLIMMYFLGGLPALNEMFLLLVTRLDSKFFFSLTMDYAHFMENAKWNGADFLCTWCCAS